MDIAILQKIDRICDGYELALRAGGDPKPTRYLHMVENPFRKILLRELLRTQQAFDQAVASLRDGQNNI